MKDSESLIQEWKNQKSKGDFVKKSFANLNKKKAKKQNLKATEIHYEVFDTLDCLDCANCCSSIPPIVNKRDISRISKTLQLSESQFISQYLTKDEDGDTVMNASPCPFLETDNTCRIYEDRPKACRQYPHTGEMEFAKNFELHRQNIQWCPAVYHILKQFSAIQ